MALLILVFLAIVSEVFCDMPISKENKPHVQGKNLNNTKLGRPVPDDCLQCICAAFNSEDECEMPKPVCHYDFQTLSPYFTYCGPYQIKEDYWKNATLKGGDLDGDWEKCTETFDCSERAVQGYMMRYATEQRIGRIPTCDDFSLIHIRGPNGFKNPDADIGARVFLTKVFLCLIGV